MVEVYGNKARQINAQHSQHKEARKEVEENKGRKKLPVPGRGIEPKTLTLKGSLYIATFTLHKDPWLQLLNEYHERYILNSIAQYPIHMKERERKKVSKSLI